MALIEPRRRFAAVLIGSHRRFAAVLLCALAYLYAYPYQATINNPNENVRLYMTAAIAELGRYDIDEFRQRWGYVNDAAVHGGHIWSVKAPGTSLLGVPAYWTYFQLSRVFNHPFDRSEALWACRVTASIIPTLLFAWFLYAWLARRARHGVSRDTVFFSVLIGSLLYGYGMMFVSHTLSAVAAFAAFMWLYDVRHAERAPTWTGAFLAGLFTGGVTLFEYPGFVASLVLAIYGAFVLKKPRWLLPFALGGLLPALIMMHFQWRAFGNAFTPGHRYVETEAFRAAHEQGFFGAVGPSAAALYGLLFEPAAGLFPLTPLLVLGLVGLVMLLRDRKQRADAIAASAIVFLTVLAIASMNNWRGGWTIGPRYLAVCVPFLAWPALVALDAWLDRLPLMAASFAIGATAAALIASGVPGVYYPHLPPEVSRPLPQIFALLIRHGFAPSSAANLVGLYGNWSMLPLLLVALVMLGMCLRSVARAQRPMALSLSGVICGFLLLPLIIRPKHEPGIREAQAFITQRYAPQGHDDAARLRDKLRAQAEPDHAELTRLAELYRDEGRDKELKALMRGKL